ncbi:LPXTG cell wall anchor domain-containing protein [Paenibacillus jiagnxiensis]|uniref:LPXTG cell wall anchor domain-containing protein n=1 Tax=Paenibacillus jiagnxiensis TaxID=3228926 RepID=UPI00339FDAE0
MVTNVDGKDVVVPFDESVSLPDLEPFTEYNASELREMLIAQAEAEANENADIDPADRPSGGSTTDTKNTPPASNTSENAVLLSASVGAAIIAGAGYMLMRKRNRKN